MNDTEHIELAIVAYLQRHPQAGDTAQGIARWWLDGATHDPRQVEAALRRLQHRGMVTSFVARDGREHWRAGAALPPP